MNVLTVSLRGLVGVSFIVMSSKVKVMASIILLPNFILWKLNKAYLHVMCISFTRACCLGSHDRFR